MATETTENKAVVSVPANQPVAQAVNVSPANSGGSPWEDDVPEAPTETKKKPMVVGSLVDEPLESAKAKPFVVPSQVEEKVGQKIPATQFIQPQSGTPVAASAKKVDSIAQTGASATPVVPVAATQTQAAESLAQTPKQAAGIAALAKKIPKIPGVPASGKGIPKGLIFGLAGFFGFLFVITVLIYLSENGVVAFGLEKVYSAVGLEKIWGGLSKDPQIALMQSAANMQNHPEYKVKGTITITVDKSVKSKITSPLVAMLQSDHESIALEQPQIRLASVQLAQTSSSANSSSTTSLYSTGSSASTTGTQSSTTSSGYQSTTTGIGSSSSTTSTTGSGAYQGSTTGTSGTGTSTTSQSTNQGYQYQGASIKEVTADVAGTFSANGAESQMKVKKVTGTQDLNLKLKSGKLWVQTGSGIKYSYNAKPDKWLEYNLSSVSATPVQKSFFGYNAGKGFSVRGSRLGTERIGNDMAYNYKIDSMEVGSSLSSLGITSGMVQNVTGHIWVGVKDKLVKKADLKVTTGSSLSVTLIDLSLEFFAYDVKNAVNEPEASTVIKNITSASNLKGDQKRKYDLSLIQDALEVYKAEHGSYPLAKENIKLNDSSNILTTTLVTDYIQTMPVDPKSAEGWFYGYKSDGMTYILSAKLENTKDPEGIASGPVYLYFVYNK